MYLKHDTGNATIAYRTDPSALFFAILELDDCVYALAEKRGRGRTGC